jgi:ADP-ribose pyrophosphatase
MLFEVYWQEFKGGFNMSKDNLPEKLDRNVIYKSDWVSLYSDKVKMPNGNIIDTYHKLHYPHESVSVVIVNENEEILMIQSKRYVTKRLEWEVPAGRIENNETAEEAARRECLEEAGCVLEDLTYLCCQNPSNGMSDLLIHVFAAKVKSETMDIDVNEVNKKKWFPKEKVMEILKNNETHCGLSMLSLLYANQFYL